MNVSLSGRSAPLTCCELRGASLKNVLLLIALGGAIGAGATRAPAAISRGPVISPSVKQAHRLKYYPPRGWIRHYLGDDRYKIGATWRVVTTPNDKFYYPPFAREMLIAPPGKIIGFASAQDAQEAGYAPAPAYGGAYGLDVHQMAADDMRNSAEPSSGANVTTINRSNRAQRIILADGVSSVLLPPNWKRTRSSVQAFYGNTMQKSDELQSLRGGGILEFSSFDVPMGGVTNFLRPQNMKQLLTRVGASGTTIGTATMGGLSGLVLTPKVGTRLPVGMGDKAIVVGRTNKAYTLAYKGNQKVPGAATILSSFRPR